MFYEPTGDDCLRWMQAVENDGLIRYLGLLNSERILVTSTQGLAELFQTRPYDFVKSPGIRKLLVVLLGDGLVVAEGNRHKVFVADSFWSKVGADHEYSSRGRTSPQRSPSGGSKTFILPSGTRRASTAPH